MMDHFPDINFESFKFFTKNIFIMKNLTDFRKTVETGMDPRLDGVFFLEWKRNFIPVTTESYFS